MRRKENGAISIEAAIILPFFMLSILALMFMSVIIKVQSQMQYAIGQTAKEISGYYYLLDKIGLASVTAGTIEGETKKNLENIDSTIANVVTFSSDLDNTTSDLAELQNLDGLSVDKIQEIIDAGSDDVEKLQKDFGDIETSLKSVIDGDRKQQIAAVLQVFGKSMVNKSFSYFVAPLVCKTLVQKYMTSGNIEDYCKEVGIEWDAVNFKNSQLLLDGRSIKVDVIYTLNTEKLTFGFVKQDLKFHQVASTAAWIRPGDENSSKKSVVDLQVLKKEEED